MSQQFSVLKSFIRTILFEASGEVRAVPISMSVSTLASASVTDQITKIRAIKGVITVGIDQESRIGSTGHKVMYLTIKFLPPPGDVMDYLTALGQAIKSVGGIDIVHIYKMGGYDITAPDGSSLVF